MRSEGLQLPSRSSRIAPVWFDTHARAPSREEDHGTGAATEGNEQTREAPQSSGGEVSSESFQRFCPSAHYRSRSETTAISLSTRTAVRNAGRSRRAAGGTVRQVRPDITESRRRLGPSARIGDGQVRYGRFRVEPGHGLTPSPCLLASLHRPYPACPSGCGRVGALHRAACPRIVGVARMGGGVAASASPPFLAGSTCAPGAGTVAVAPGHAGPEIRLAGAAMGYS